MTPAQLEIARRVRSCDHWRAMDGMPVLHPVHPEKRWRWAGGQMVPMFGGEDWLDDPDLDDCVPLLGDPAADGCLHAQACERYCAAQIQVIVDIAPRMTGPSGTWRAVDARGRFMAGGPIPTDILSAFPDNPHAAAVCAALRNEDER